MDVTLQLSSQDDEDKIILCVNEIQQKFAACITWTKKSQKGASFLQQAQEHCGIPKQRLLSPVKTRFAYLILSFQTLLDNRKAMDHLYGEKTGVPAKIKKRKPTWQEWAVAEAIVLLLKDVTGLITVNQACGDQWLLSDAMNDFICVYNKCAKGGKVVHPGVLKLIESLKILHDNSEEVMDFAPRLTRLSTNICRAVEKKLKVFLDPFLTLCHKKKSHMFFALILDPRYLQLSSIIELHESENIDSSKYFVHMMDLLLEYVIAAEERKNPSVKVSTKNTRSSYILPDLLSFGDVSGEDASVETQKTRGKREFEAYKLLVKTFFSRGGKMESSTDVLKWYKEN